MRWSWLALGGVASLVFACSGTESGAPPVTTSAVSGQLTLASYPAAPTGVDALDEAGARTHAPIAADGRFTLQLTKGHLYSLLVLVPGAEEPLVFPRGAARLDKSFRVSSGAAVVALGSVRHYDKAPDTGFAVTKPSSTLTTKSLTLMTDNVETGEHEDGDDDDGEDGECVNGVIQGTNTPCVDDDDQTQCENGKDEGDGDGECENGKDVKTGLACTDDDSEGESADPLRPMSVPDQNAPKDVSGCADGGDGDGEEEDD